MIAEFKKHSVVSALFLFLLFPFCLFSQSPDVVFRIRTGDGVSGPYPQWITATSSWSNTYTSSIGNLA